MSTYMCLDTCLDMCLDTCLDTRLDAYIRVYTRVSGLMLDTYNTCIDIVYSIIPSECIQSPYACV